MGGIQLLDRINQYSPNFVARQIPKHTSMKCYLFGDYESSFGEDPAKAFEYAWEVLESNAQLRNAPKQYMIPLIWADKKDRMVDYFMYSDLKTAKNVGEDWRRGNPNEILLVTRNGMVEDHPACGDGLFVRYAEESFRRATNDWMEFMGKMAPLSLMRLKERD